MGNIKDRIVNDISRVKEKKLEKEKKLLDTAFLLFTKNGIKNTSIQDIVDNAGVAKGTFYLYFKDKYDIQDCLIMNKSSQLFNDALDSLEEKNILKFDDQIIFVIDYVIDELVNDKNLLKFISKNLSLGVYNDNFSKVINGNSLGIHQLFIKGVKDNNINLPNPDITLFMIIELVSSTCFSSIIYKKPIDINTYKPYLYDTIRHMINQK